MVLLICGPMQRFLESLPTAGTLERVQSLRHWRTLPSRVRWLAQGRGGHGERRFCPPGRPLLTVHTGSVSPSRLSFVPQCCSPAGPGAHPCGSADGLQPGPVCALFATSGTLPNRQGWPALPEACGPLCPCCML